jgi:hypothetical protein
MMPSLNESTPCWGRAGAAVCDACTRLQAPELIGTESAPASIGQAVEVVHAP